MIHKIVGLLGITKYEIWQVSSYTVVLPGDVEVVDEDSVGVAEVDSVSVEVAVLSSFVSASVDGLESAEASESVAVVIDSSMAGICGASSVLLPKPPEPKLPKVDKSAAGAPPSARPNERRGAPWTKAPMGPVTRSAFKRPFSSVKVVNSTGSPS